jgi:hypothetical protein
VEIGEKKLIAKVPLIQCFALSPAAGVGFPLLIFKTI